MVVEPVCEYDGRCKAGLLRRVVRVDRFTDMARQAAAAHATLKLHLLVGRLFCATNTRLRYCDPVDIPTHPVKRLMPRID